MKKVSIIIPTYKRAARLSKTVESALAQSYSPIEVIVVDDNSPESPERLATEKIMKRYAADERVCYVKHDKNRNGAAARNTGLEISQGSFICFLDDDDIIYPKKIEKQVRFLEDHPEYDMVYCIRKEGKRIHANGAEGDLSVDILGGFKVILTIALLFRREALLKAGGWDEAFRRNQEAVVLLNMFIAGSRIGYVNEVLCESFIDDRSNADSPKKNEAAMAQLLTNYRDFIDGSGAISAATGRRIVAHRDMGVTLSLIKSGDISYTGGYIFRSFKKNPGWFPFYLSRQVLYKILRVQSNGYRKKTGK